MFLQILDNLESKTFFFFFFPLLITIYISQIIQRKLVFEELTKSIPQVLSILTGYLSPSNDKQLKNRSLKGIQNWFRFGIPLEYITISFQSFFFFFFLNSID